MFKYLEFIIGYWLGFVVTYTYCMMKLWFN